MKSTENKNEMTSSARKTAILEILNEDGEVRVADLSDKLQSSMVTIRKYLDELGKEGLVERVHGGAKKNYRLQQNVLLSERMNFHKEEKKKIAEAASDLINDGDSIIVNVGSTSLYVAQQLRKKKNLIVITNALQIVNEITCYKNITTIMLGGKFDHEMGFFYGDDTYQQLSKYNVDKLFTGMDGVDLVAGATTYNHTEDTSMAKMMEGSKEKILVVDDTKIGRVTFAHIASLSAFDTLITNYSQRHERFYREAEQLGLRVITV